VVSNPAGVTDVCLLLCVEYFQVDVSALGLSLVQGSHTECGVSECDREAPIMRRSWPTRGFCPKKIKIRVALDGLVGGFVLVLKKQRG
jgi:hypothetical protein